MAMIPLDHSRPALFVFCIGSHRFRERLREDTVQQHIRGVFDNFSWKSSRAVARKVTEIDLSAAVQSCSLFQSMILDDRIFVFCLQSILRILSRIEREAILDPGRAIGRDLQKCLRSPSNTWPRLVKMFACYSHLLDHHVLHGSKPLRSALSSFVYSNSSVLARYAPLSTSLQLAKLCPGSDFVTAMDFIFDQLEEVDQMKLLNRRGRIDLPISRKPSRHVQWYVENILERNAGLRGPFPPGNLRFGPSPRRDRIPRRIGDRGYDSDDDIQYGGLVPPGFHRNQKRIDWWF